MLVGEERSGERFDLAALLERAEAGSPVEAVDAVADELAAMVGARGVSFLIADYSGQALLRFTRATTEGPRAARLESQPTRAGLDGEQGETVELAGTVYQRVLRTQRVDVRGVHVGGERGEWAGLTTKAASAGSAPAEGGTSSPPGTGTGLVWVTAPVTDRGDALGVLELVLPYWPDEHVIKAIGAAGHALAYIVVANRRHTDLFEWARRDTHFSLAAEIQRRLLPDAFTCEAAQFSVAGWLEPAATIGGDTFDYTVDRSSLQLSITDAVGHEVEAALLATLLVNALRNERRKGVDLAEQARAANDALAREASVGKFVTGQILRVDLNTGEAVIVNAGHPWPLRLRDGVVEEVALNIDQPFGLDPGRSFQVQTFSLRPGDRIVFLSDGMLERNAAEVDVAAVLARSRDLHPREMVQSLGATVLRACDGDLKDDATVMALDWYGGPSQARYSRGGASQHLASGPSYTSAGN